MTMRIDEIMMIFQVIDSLFSFFPVMSWVMFRVMQTFNSYE